MRTPDFTRCQNRLTHPLPPFLAKIRLQESSITTIPALALGRALVFGSDCAHATLNPVAEGDVVYIACSTLCFGKSTFEQSLRNISDLKFQKIDLAIHEHGPHLKPSEVVADVNRYAQYLRSTGFSYVAFHVEIDAPDFTVYKQHLRAVCHLGRLMAVAVITIRAAEVGADIEEEIKLLEPASANRCRRGGSPVNRNSPRHRDRRSSDRATFVQTRSRLGRHARSEPLCRRPPWPGRSRSALSLHSPRSPARHQRGRDADAHWSGSHRIRQDRDIARTRKLRTSTNGRHSRPPDAQLSDRARRCAS